MVQKATAKRGRPPKFDRDAVISAAIAAFFEKGYENTTLGDLETATGVDRSTLYNSFDGKAGLYELATSAYLENAETWLFEPLHHGDRAGYDDLLDFLARLRLGLTSPEAIPGCLIVNDMAARTAPEAAARYRQRVESGLLAALERAADAEAATRASLLTASVIGVNLVSKVTADPGEIGRSVDAMISTVEGWQAAA